MRKDRNIVVILPGGLRADVLSRFSPWSLRTPNLASMAEAGLALTGVAASPASTPARISLLTGLHPRQHAVLDEGVTVDHVGGWVRRFDEAGYHVAGIGRVEPIMQHLHEAASVADLSAGDGVDCAYRRYLHHRGLLTRFARLRDQRLKLDPFAFDNFGLTAPSDDIDGFITHQALMTIDRLPTDKPWLLIVAYTGPGNDLPAPPNYLQRINTTGLAAGFSPIDQRNADDYAESPYPRAVLQRMTPKALAELRRHYLARVSMLDQMVGMIHDAVDRQAHAHTTWTLLASDTGRLLGERGLLGTRSMLGPAVYVPLWTLPPKGFNRRKPSSELIALNHRLISSVDWVATLCMIGGVDPPRGCCGQSLLPALHGDVVGREAVISEFGTRLMLETMQHRVTFDVETDEPRSLFDLVKDPHEARDLIGDPEELVLMDMLRYQLAGALMPLRPIRGAA